MVRNDQKSLLSDIGVSAPERKSIKDDLSLWYPKDLKHLSPAEIVTELQYCSRSARQAMYTIAKQLNDSGEDIELWDPEWDIVALMKSGVYYNNFKTHWQIRTKTKVSLKTGPQDDPSIPKKKITLQAVPVNPDKDWVTRREDILKELARGSHFLQLSTALETYNINAPEKQKEKAPQTTTPGTYKHGLPSASNRTS